MNPLQVVEIINGDGMVVKMADGSLKKIFLASVRSPRAADVAATDESAGKQLRGARTRPRALYDIPYMFEAREFLRKKLVGKKVRLFRRRLPKPISRQPLSCTGHCWPLDRCV